MTTKGRYLHRWTIMVKNLVSVIKERPLRRQFEDECSHRHSLSYDYRINIYIFSHLSFPKSLPVSNDSLIIA